MNVQHQGKASRGSQFWLQKLVNEQPETLNKAIGDAAPTLAGQAIKWMSPLASEAYREYRDQAFLKKLDIQLSKRPLGDFWPVRGPVWDALARTSDNEVILVEAKSHIPEAVSPPSRASEKSLKLIRSSLGDTKKYLNGRRDSDWSGIFYQVTNRLAHLYLLKILNKLPAHLVFIYFVGDQEMNGPDSEVEWTGAIRTIEVFLGIERTKLSSCVHHVYLDVRGI